MTSETESLSALRERHFPQDTCGASRHVQMICEGELADDGAERKLLLDAGYDPDHWRLSMETVVRELWKARARVRALETSHD